MLLKEEEPAGLGTTRPRLPRTIVIGARGFLGRHLLAAYRAVHPGCLGTEVAPGRPAHLDLAAPDVRPLRLRESGYRQAVIAAAVTGLARCERERAYARARNVDGTLELARQLTEAGVMPVFFSSDNVFDGREGSYLDDTPTCPVNEYGRQKAEVERRLPEVCGGHCLIVRLGRIFGLTRGDQTLLDEMAGLLTQGRDVAAAWDHVLCPLVVGDAVRAVIGLQMAGATGVVNVCGPEVWTRFDLALAVADALGVGAVRVKKISLNDLHEPFRRPHRTDMVCPRLAASAPLTFQPLATSIASIARSYQPGNGAASESESEP